MVPYRSTAVPPALVDTNPPIVAEPSEASDSGKRLPTSSEAACTAARVTPASATITSSKGSTSRIARSRSSDSSTSP